MGTWLGHLCSFLHKIQTVPQSLGIGKPVKNVNTTILVFLRCILACLRWLIFQKEIFFTFLNVFFASIDDFAGKMNQAVGKS